MGMCENPQNSLIASPQSAILPVNMVFFLCDSAHDLISIILQKFLVFVHHRYDLLLNIPCNRVQCAPVLTLPMRSRSQSEE
jgi:hypothetical protein